MHNGRGHRGWAASHSPTNERDGSCRLVRMAVWVPANWSLEQWALRAGGVAPSCMKAKLCPIGAHKV